MDDRDLSMNIHGFDETPYMFEMNHVDICGSYLIFSLIASAIFLGENLKGLGACPEFAHEQSTFER